MSINQLNIGDDIELAAARKHHSYPRKLVESIAKPAAGFSDALGNHANLALLACIKRENAVGLLEVDPAQYDRLGTIQPVTAPWFAHLFSPVVRDSMQESGSRSQYR